MTKNQALEWQAQWKMAGQPVTFHGTANTLDEIQASLRGCHQDMLRRFSQEQLASMEPGKVIVTPTSKPNTPNGKAKK